MTATDQYAVFGNPIRHSLSPQIHAAFAEECGQAMQYRAVRVEPGKFAAAADRFFGKGGRGLNVTVPFKTDACEYADMLSPRARLAGAVNTLRREDDGRVFGDTTDGVGLLRDMIANLGWQLAGQRILVLGAGGAVRGVLELVLREKPEAVVLANRTAARARELATEFSAFGPITGGGYELLDEGAYGIIINGTSASLANDLPPLRDTLLTERSCCYDMMYGAQPTLFMRWAAQHAAWAVSDGLGMLVEQAAESFYLWRGSRPGTGSVIASLRARLQEG